MGKIFDANFRFHAKLRITERVQYLVLSNFSLVLIRSLFRAEDLALGYSFM